MSDSLAAPGGRQARARDPFILRESDIQRTITDFLKAEQWRVFHFEDGFDERSKKRKGEPGMPDLLAIRYGHYQCDPGCSHACVLFCVLWLELKRIDKRGRITKASQAQKDWHAAERARGALTLIAGEDFPATIEGFLGWYRASGLMRQ